MSHSTLRSRVMPPRPIHKTWVSSQRLSTSPRSPVPRPAPCSPNPNALQYVRFSALMSPGLSSPRGHRTSNCFASSLAAMPRSPFLCESPRGEKVSLSHVEYFYLDTPDGSEYPFEAMKPFADVPTEPLDSPSTVSAQLPLNSQVVTARPRRLSVRFTDTPAKFDASGEPLSSSFPVSPYPRSPSDTNMRVNSRNSLRRAPYFTGRQRRRSNSRSGSLARSACVRFAVTAAPGNLHHRPAEIIVPDNSDFALPRISVPVLDSAPVLSPVPESPTVSEISVESYDSTTTRSSVLSSAFWRSMSLTDLEDTDDEVESCIYPPSAQALQEHLDEITPPLSPSPSVFPRINDVMWSPGLPRKRGQSFKTFTSSPLSPRVNQSFKNSAELYSITSPPTQDPYNSFSSFSTALSNLGAEKSVTFAHTHSGARPAI